MNSHVHVINTLTLSVTLTPYREALLLSTWFLVLPKAFELQTWKL